jgi:hypothetical protein
MDPLLPPRLTWPGHVEPRDASMDVRLQWRQFPEIRGMVAIGRAPDALSDNDYMSSEARRPVLVVGAGLPPDVASADPAATRGRLP